MGGLRAASPSPPPLGAGPDPAQPAPAPPRVAMASVVASEVATVLAVMRRNVRYDGGGADEHLEHRLIAGLKSLRRRAAGWGRPGGWRDDVDPLLYLRPFLDVVRSDETGAPITGAALSSLHKLLSLDLVGPAAPNVAGAMGAVVDAVAGCRFEVTDPASEEAVLARVLQVLLACVRGRAAPVLSNHHVCAIVSTCFRVVQQAGTKGELLQRVSRQTMQEVIRCVFARLPDLDATVLADEQSAAQTNDASVSLHRCLGTDGISVSPSTWLMSFDIIFQLLDELLEITQNRSPKDFRNMEMSLLHAVKLLCKVFLQSLKDLSAQSSFGKLWSEVLDMIEKFMKVKLRGRRLEKLQEAIPELVKNVLMVMKASGILSKTKTGENSLWEATWFQVNNILPVLQSEVFPDNDGRNTKNTKEGEQNKLDTPTQSD
ncbi:unnamed protein product [Urochloa humidicola]